jgi:hypothetical protein
MQINTKYFFRELISFAIIILFGVIFYWPIFFQKKTVSPFDLCYFKYPTYSNQKPKELRRPSNPLLSDPVNVFQPWDIAMVEGPLHFPWLWNPYSGFGSPMLANAESAVFFPLKYVAYLWGARKGFGYLCFFKTTLAGIFMWLYLRALKLGTHARLIGSIAFMASGFMIVWIQWPHTSSALFLPLMFLGCEYIFVYSVKKGFLIITIATTISLFGGHPETSFHCIVATLIYIIGYILFRIKSIVKTSTTYEPHRLVYTLLFISGAICLGSLLASVQIIPTIEYIWNSYILHYRAEIMTTTKRNLLFNLNNLRYIYKEFLFYLVPDTWGNPSIHDFWWRNDGLFSNYNEHAGYIGIGILLLAFFAWSRLRSSRVIFSFLLLQLLSFGFIFRIPFIEATLGALPPFNVVLNKRFLLIFCFSNAAMAAIIFDRLLKGEKVQIRSMLWFLFIGALLLMLPLIDFLKRFAFHSDSWIQNYGLKNLFHSFIFLIPWFSVIILRRLSQNIRKVFASALLILVCLDLYSIYGKYNPFINPDEIYTEPRPITYLKRQNPPVRVLPISNQIMTNFCSIHGINDVRNYDGINIAWYGSFLEYIGWSSVLPQVIKPDFNHRIASLSSARYYWVPETWSSNSDRMKLAYSDGTCKLYENLDTLPHAYIASSWEIVDNYKDAISILNKKNFPWKKRIIIEGNTKNICDSSTLLCEKEFLPVTISHYQPNLVEVSLPDEAVGILVLNDCFYPGWTATVDGCPAKIYRVNGTFRGVFIKRENKRVVFHYNPLSFKVGLLITLISLVVIGPVVFKKLPGNGRQLNNESLL